MKPVKYYTDIGHDHDAELFLVMPDGSFRTVEGGCYEDTNITHGRVFPRDEFNAAVAQGRYCRSTDRASCLATSPKTPDKKLAYVAKQIERKYGCLVIQFSYDGDILTDA